MERDVIVASTLGAPDRFPGPFSFVRAVAPGTVARLESTGVGEGRAHAPGNGQVVQQREGLQLYLSRRGRVPRRVYSLTFLEKLSDK